MKSETAIHINELDHNFNNKIHTTKVLKNINLDIVKGEYIAMLGKSGSGKSTLLNLIAGFMKPTKGIITIFDQDITGCNEKELTLFRRRNIGYIFQNYNLIKTMTVIENVAFPLEIKGINKKRRMEVAAQIINEVSMCDRMDYYPHHLSGGELQRVAIARVLIQDPKIILADEPTGNLDTITEKQILELLKDINKSNKTTIILVTHDKDIAYGTDRILHLKNGSLESFGGIQ